MLASATALLFVAVTEEPAGASACDIATITWDGGGGTTAWGTATNWTGDRLPNSDDHVCIPTGTPAASVVHSTGTTVIKTFEAQKTFTLSGGSIEVTSGSVDSKWNDGSFSAGVLTGSGRVSILGTVTWSAGTMSGNGTTHVAAAGVLNITTTSTSSSLNLQTGRILDNDGTIDFSGTGYVNGYAGARLDNSGTVKLSNSGRFHDRSSTATPDPHIDNSGTLQKTGGSSASDVYWSIDNDGAVSNSSGVALTLRGGSAGTDSTGSFANATFATGTYTLANSLLSGTSALGGTVSLPAGTTTTIATGSTTTLTAVLNGPGALQVDGTVSWTGGNVKDSATVAVTASGRLDIVTSGCCSNRNVGPNATFNNSGVMTLNNGEGLDLLDNVRINNSGRFEWTPGGYSNIFDESTTIKPQIINSGTILKPSGDDKPIGVPVQNTGTVRADIGTLILSAGSGPDSSTGTYAGGVTLTGAHALSGASFTGSGNTLGGTPSVGQGSSSTIETGSTTDLTGVLSGPGTLQVDGTLRWTAGNVKDSATVAVGSGGRLDIVTSCCSNRTVGPNATFNNGGIMTLNSSEGLTLLDNVAINNSGRFEWTMSTYSEIMAGSSTIITPKFLNSGTLVKVGGNDRSISIPVQNTGTVRADVGTITLSGGSGPDASTGTYAGGVILTGTHILSGARFSGTGNTMGGTISLPKATSSTIVNGSSTALNGVLTGDAALRVEGQLVWSGGNVKDSATVVVTPSGRFDIQVGGSSNRQVGPNATFVSSGVTTYNGGEGLTFLDNVEFENLGTFDWTPGGYSEIADGSTTNRPVFNNSGIFRKFGTASRPINVVVENDGVIEVDAGTVQLNGRFRPFSRSRSALVEGEYILRGQLRVANLNVVRNGARVTLDGTAAALLDSGGNSGFRNFARNTGSGRLTLLNGATLSSPGAFRNAGVVKVGPSSTFTVPGGYTQTRGATVVDDATSRVVATSGIDVQGGSLRGLGTFEANVTNASGTIMPGGTTRGRLTIQGSYTQGSLGSIDLDIDGLTAFDSLAVTGQASLDGRLALFTAANYLPAVGDAFELVAHGSAVGTFSSAFGLDLANGYRHVLSYQPQAVLSTIQGPAPRLQPSNDEGGSR